MLRFMLSSTSHFIRGTDFLKISVTGNKVKLNFSSDQKRHLLFVFHSFSSISVNERLIYLWDESVNV